jgi:galactitol-specific phosphotransferase system IIC component
MRKIEDDNNVLRKRVGIAGESMIIGAVLLAVLTSVLYINGNSLRFSIAVGIVLGAVTGLCRYLVQNYRS